MFVNEGRHGRSHITRAFTTTSGNINLNSFHFQKYDKVWITVSVISVQWSLKNYS